MTNTGWKKQPAVDSIQPHCDGVDDGGGDDDDDGPSGGGGDSIHVR